MELSDEVLTSLCECNVTQCGGLTTAWIDPRGEGSMSITVPALAVLDTVADATGPRIVAGTVNSATDGEDIVFFIAPMFQSQVWHQSREFFGGDCRCDSVASVESLR